LKYTRRLVTKHPARLLLSVVPVAISQANASCKTNAEIKLQANFALGWKFGEAHSWRHGVVPVPERMTVCGEPVALSVATRLAVAVPVAAGLNAIDSVQLAPAAREVEHVFAVNRKSLALVPVKV
jgi:hypothetical protein